MAKAFSERSRTVVTVGLLSAILVAVQVGLAFLPNIELVSVLILVFALTYKRKVFYIIYVFALLEGLIYGFGIWWFNYLYVWTVWAIIVMIMRKNNSVIIWAIACGAFGLGFGALCAIPYFITGGIGGGIAYWTAGIPYDITHCIANFAVTFILFKPLMKLMETVNRQQNKN